MTANQGPVYGASGSEAAEALGAGSCVSGAAEGAGESSRGSTGEPARGASERVGLAPSSLAPGGGCLSQARASKTSARLVLVALRVALTFTIGRVFPQSRRASQFSTPVLAAGRCDPCAKGQTAEFAQLFARGYGLGVDLRTRRRVLLDTTPRRLGRFLALALLLHLPLTPLSAFSGLLRLLGKEPEAPVLPPVTEIPLDIIDDEGAAAGNKGPEPATSEPEAPAPPAAELPKEPDAPPVEKPKPKKPKPPKPPEPPDAGAPEDAGAPHAPDAGAPDAGAPEPPKKPGEGIGSPVAGIGDKHVVDPNANVLLLVHNDRVRAQPLGERIGPLLKNVYQWRDFFGPTAIDPVRDIDRMLIVGPQLRDSRDVVAILQFNVPAARVRDAVNVLVARDPEGGWQEGPVPVAKAHADRGERAFVFPSPQILVVTPPSAQASAQRLPRKFRLPAPKGEELALAKIATPWRAFRGSPIAIPKSISSAELRLSPGADGGVVIDVLAHDESEGAATSDARSLTGALDLGLMGLVALGTTRLQGGFEADAADIRGQIVLSRKNVLAILELARGLLGGGPPPPRPTSAAPTSPPVVPSPAASP